MTKKKPLSKSSLNIKNTWSKKRKQFEENFEGLKKRIRNGTRGEVKYNIEIRRRLRADKFSAEDLLFKINFNSSDSENSDIPLISVGLTIYYALTEIIQKISKEYDQSKKRLAFFTISTPSMVNSINLGGVDIHNPSDEIADRLMNAAFRYLISHSTIELGEGLTITCLVVGLNHQKMIEQIRLSGTTKDIKFYNLLDGNRSRSLYRIPI